MQIYHRIEEFIRLECAVVTSGTFDGVHFGHQKIISRIVELAAQKNGESVVLTFWPHPRFVLKKDNDFKLLSSFEEKAECLKNLGVDHLIKIEFTNEFSQLSSLEFINNILIEAIGTKYLVIGYDHRFGKNREGSFEYIKKNKSTFGFEVEEISKQDIDEIAVSSTKIRKALLEGKVELVSKYLNENYSVQGKVVKGDQIGRTLGYPTANIKPDFEEKLIPKDGIYAIRAHFEDEILPSVASIGTRPTFNGKDRRIEAHIFDFQKDIYGKMVKVEFVKFIREELKFDNKDGLITQMKEDEKVARLVLQG